VGRSTVWQMRVGRVDAVMAIRPYMVLALKQEFLTSGFDRQLPTQLFSRDLVGDQFGGENRQVTHHAPYRGRADATLKRSARPTTGPAITVKPHIDTIVRRCSRRSLPSASGAKRADLPTCCQDYSGAAKRDG
jgi:hypothetical protein